MLPLDPQDVVDRLIEFQRTVRAGDRIATASGNEPGRRAGAADTIYAIDTVVEPMLEDFCRDWAQKTPLVLIAEGVENETGVEGVKVFPEGEREQDAQIRLLVDPIDGTRGIMYDKRPAWALAGVAPNKGPHTRLRDIEVAVMTELPTSKMGFGDVLWAIKGRSARGVRVDLSNAAHAGSATAPVAGGRHRSRLCQHQQFLSRNQAARRPSVGAARRAAHRTRRHDAGHGL